MQHYDAESGVGGVVNKNATKSMLNPDSSQPDGAQGGPYHRPPPYQPTSFVLHFYVILFLQRLLLSILFLNGP